MPGCWVVWREDIESPLVEVFDNELDAYRSAHGGGGGISFEVTWVPFGFSPYGVLEVEKHERKVARAEGRDPVMSDRTRPAQELASGRRPRTADQGDEDEQGGVA